MKNLNFIIIFVLSINITFSSETLITPESNGIDNLRESLREFLEPYQKFWPVGLFTKDPRLQYTIPEHIIKLGYFSKYRSENLISPFKLLALLSENYWIALNKRKLEYTIPLAIAMEQIIVGKFGLQEITTTPEIATSFYSLWFRCIEQIQLSKRFLEDHVISLPLEIVNNPLAIRNYENYKAAYDAAKFITNTPLLPQMVSYEIIKNINDNDEYSETDPNYNSPEVIKKRQERSLQRQTLIALEPYYILGNQAVSYIINNRQEHRFFIKRIISLKKNMHKLFGKALFTTLNQINRAEYKIIDRGQNSNGHYNTCMFNSLYYYDLAQNNISSTKIGSLKKAEQYIIWLAKLLNNIPEYTSGDTKTQLETRMLNTISKIEKTRGNEAIYAQASFILTQMDTIISGNLIQDCSIAEMSSANLQSNFVVFFNPQKNTKANLAATYNGGFLMSSNFSITPISCTSGHARSLVKC